MNTVKIQMKRMVIWPCRWVLRIVFFPIWFFFLWRRSRGVKVFLNGVEQHQGDATYTLPEKIDTPPIAISYRLEVLNSDGDVRGSRPATMTEEKEGFVCRAAFTFDEPVTLVTSRLYREGKLLGDRKFIVPVETQQLNVVHISHSLLPEVIEPEPRHKMHLHDAHGKMILWGAASLKIDCDRHIYSAEFPISGSMNIYGSSVYTDDTLIGTELFETATYCAAYDVLKILHIHEPKKLLVSEPVKNAELRRMQLMTRHSQKCKSGEFPTNHFALIGDGYHHDLGEAVNIKYHEWYPKAMLVEKDGSILVSYNPNTPLFKLIEEKSKEKFNGAMVGPEFIFELEDGELVTMFCGSSSSKRAAANVDRTLGAEHIVAHRTVSTPKFSWTVPFFTTRPTRPKSELRWMDEPLEDLNNKRLWNIIQAVQKGEWASGSKVRFAPSMQQALWDEYNWRKKQGAYTKKKIKKIKKANKKYEAKQPKVVELIDTHLYDR